MLYCIPLAEEADFVGRLALQIAMFYVQDLVEKAAYVETKPEPLLFAEVPGLFLGEYPTPVGSCEFQFVAVFADLVRAYGRADLRHFEMADPHKLVIDLLSLCLQLHLIGKYLPFASSAHSEMTAERLKPVGRRGDKALYASLKVVLFMFGNQNINHIARHGKFHKQHPGTCISRLGWQLCVSESLAFSGYGLNCDIFYYYSFLIFHCSILTLGVAILKPFASRVV